MTDDDDVGALSEIVSLKMSAVLNEEIEADLDSPLSKSEWIRDACRQKLGEEQEPAAPVSE